MGEHRVDGLSEYEGQDLAILKQIGLWLGEVFAGNILVIPRPGFIALSICCTKMVY